MSNPVARFRRRRRIMFLAAVCAAPSGTGPLDWEKVRGEFGALLQEEFGVPPTPTREEARDAR
jgi:hypothetical protein